MEDHRQLTYGFSLEALGQDQPNELPNVLRLLSSIRKDLGIHVVSTLLQCLVFMVFLLLSGI